LFIAHYTQVGLAVFGYCNNLPVTLSNSAACYNETTVSTLSRKRTGSQFNLLHTDE